ncbi:chromate transporter [Scopulibacillus daqui]|uniref:Chromate transporter n=1 Tax=Scopulibacillus daqui TaxID=1469162 RepID=A0ABS2PZW4_9BACL|nr:chromate transporter [Scopulibacillus daqui]MBM7645590.1 chromate transporter [Scopulibacillus daqui]
MQQGISLKALWQLFFAFCKISPVTFGGGYAIIPSLEEAMVNRYRWCKRDEILDVLSIAQTIPGSVALNAAAFIGYRVAGIPGVLAASIGMLLPTFLIVLVLAVFFIGIKDMPQVRWALFGIAPAVVGLIMFAGLRTIKSSVEDIVCLFLMIGTFLLLLLTNLNPIIILILGGTLGGVLGWIKYKKNEKNKPENDIKRHSADQ